MQYKHSKKLSHHIITMFRKIIIIFLIGFFISLFLYGITTLEGVSNIGDTGVKGLSAEQLHSERIRLKNRQAAEKKQQKIDMERKRRENAEAVRKAALVNAEKRRQEFLAKARRQQAKRDEERRKQGQLDEERRRQEQKSKPATPIKNTVQNVRNAVSNFFGRRR